MSASAPRGWVQANPSAWSPTRVCCWQQDSSSFIYTADSSWLCCVSFSPDATALLQSRTRTLSLCLGMGHALGSAPAAQGRQQHILTPQQVCAVQSKRTGHIQAPRCARAVRRAGGTAPFQQGSVNAQSRMLSPYDENVCCVEERVRKVPFPSPPGCLYCAKSLPRRIKK